MKRRNTLFLAAFAFASAAGCQAILGIDDTALNPDSGASSGTDASSGADAGGDSSSPADASSPSLSLSPSSVRILPGASQDVGVTIVRAGITGDVTVSADDLDAGAGIASIVIADGQTTGTLHVTVSPSSKPGSQVVANVHASLTGAASAPLTIAIPGPPGTVDQTFANGEAALALGDAGFAASARGLGVQSDGKIVVGAVAYGPGPSGWAIVRLDQSGALDTAFDDNALLATPQSGALSGLIVGPLDDVWAVGTSNNQITVVHLNADGTRDNKFGTLGIATTSPVQFNNGSSGQSVAVQSDDKPIVVGIDRAGNIGVVVRFGLDGDLDNTFGSNGRTELDVAHYPVNVKILGDDSILATGTDHSSGIINPMFVMRMTKNGSLDTTFTPTGYSDTVVMQHANAQGVANVPDSGYIVVGGDQTGQIQGLIAQFPYDGGAPVSETDIGYPVSLNTTLGSVGVQPGDDRFLFTGNGGGSSDHTTFLLRMLSPTVRDPSFADGGGVVFFADHSMPSSIPYRYFYTLAFTPDGRAVVGGNQQNSGVLVMRIWL